ncbi:hypothetical protein PI124_g16452 [Phytophthora idaei]|nr:hypothetical protein PI125_g2344 [Phytophthora idaei]KAG3139143.1 hypothetical protein PI126_g16596 [Phytophthora idaei]KAG3238595.1 hypothetical protein PI124_g16452 [Phytophthora idaei]
MVIANCVTAALNDSRLSLPAPTADLTSPPGRPFRISAATARTVTAQLLENTDVSVEEVLSASNTQSNSADSVSIATGTPTDPIALSGNSSSSLEPGARW